MKPGEVRMLEFLHSLGWTPFEIYRRGRLAYWRKRMPHFKHRVAKYARVSPKKKEAGR